MTSAIQIFVSVLLFLFLFLIPGVLVFPNNPLVSTILSGVAVILGIIVVASFVLSRVICWVFRR